MNIVRLNAVSLDGIIKKGSGGGGGVTINNQEKSLEITENGTIEVVADAGFTGLGKITINVNVPTGTPTYENGVYVQHIDGKLYTTDEWTAKGFANDEANGVAVVADEAKFVIAKNTLSNVYGATSKAPSSGYFTTSEDAMKDMGGRNTTTELLDEASKNAIYYCASYVFPNGAKGYLPAYGEMYVASLWNADIQTAMAAIGGVTTEIRVWTSTFSENRMTWYFFFLGTRSGTTNSYNTKASAIPFTELVL